MNGDKQKNIEELSSEELAILLQQSYEQMLINQTNIRSIMQEIIARQQRHATAEKEITNAT